MRYIHKVKLFYLAIKRDKLLFLFHDEFHIYEVEWKKPSLKAYIWVHLYKGQELAKLIGDDRFRIVTTHPSSPWDWVQPWKKQERIFWGAGNFPDLDLCGNDTSISRNLGSVWLSGKKFYQNLGNPSDQHLRSPTEKATCVPGKNKHGQCIFTNK